MSDLRRLPAGRECREAADVRAHEEHVLVLVPAIRGTDAPTFAGTRRHVILVRTQILYYSAA